MRLYSKETGKVWLAAKDLDDGSGSIVERGSLRLIQSFLTDCLTATNLIILTGLGTSLCVATEAGQSGAPTMADLWKAAAEKAGAKFDTVLKAVGYEPVAGQENIETLLSKCKVAQDFLPDSDARHIDQHFGRVCRVGDRDRHPVEVAIDERQRETLDLVGAILKEAELA